MGGTACWLDWLSMAFAFFGGLILKTIGRGWSLLLELLPAYHLDLCVTLGHALYRLPCRLGYVTDRKGTLNAREGFHFNIREKI